LSAYCVLYIRILPLSYYKYHEIQSYYPNGRINTAYFSRNSAMRQILIIDAVQIISVLINANEKEKTIINIYVYTYIYIYIYMYIYICIYTFSGTSRDIIMWPVTRAKPTLIHKYIYVNIYRKKMYVNVYIYVYIHNVTRDKGKKTTYTNLHTYIHICTYKNMKPYLYMCVCAYIFIYICILVYIFIYIY
jgi:hypothetical protein